MTTPCRRLDCHKPADIKVVTAGDLLLLCARHYKSLDGAR